MAIEDTGPSLGGHRRLRLPNGLEILCQTETEARFFYRDIFEEEIYCRHGLSFEGASCIFDVGANIGLFSLLAAERQPQARIYSFEPAPPLFAILRENLKRFGNRVEVFQCGLSNTCGTAELTFYPNSSGLSSFHPDSEEEKAVLLGLIAEEARRGDRGAAEVLKHADDLIAERLRANHFACRLTTVSEIIRERAVDQIDLLKIDVQKSELEVIQGIEDEHWPRINQIVLELHNTDGQYPGLRDLLTRHGFRVAAEQESAYRDSPMLNVFATRAARPSASRRSPAVDTVDNAVGSEVGEAAFLFPGLGSHYFGMGAGLYNEEPGFRREFDVCAEILGPHLGLDPRRFIRETPMARIGKGPDLRRMVRGELGQEVGEELLQTRLAQPVLFALEYALARFLMSQNIKPGAMIGYSIGEYVAACLAGVISLVDALELVARRAQMIDELPRGAMTAVTLGQEALCPLLTDSLSLSAVNAPELCVIGGPEADLARLERSLADRGVLCRRLATTHAFHSQMMRPIFESFRELVGQVPLAEPRIPYVSNVSGSWIQPQEATDPSYWAHHLCEPVQFSKGLTELTRQAALLEVGPGQALSAWALQQPDATNRDQPVIATMRHPFDPQSDGEALSNALARLAAVGIDPTSPQDDGRSPVLTPVDPGKPRSHTPPRNELEEAISALWCELLRREKIGIDENFFAIGGDSLKAVRFLTRAEEEFDVALPLRELFAKPTVADFSTALLEAQAAQVGSELLEQALGEIELR